MKHLIIILTTLLGFTVTSYAQESEMTDSVNTIDTAKAEITFNEPAHDYGTIPFAGNGQCEFVFTNTGTAPLILSNVTSSCGCTVPTWPKDAINPGETGVIKVEYNTRRSGTFTKGITVESNSARGTVRVLITGTVAPQSDKPILGE